MIYKIVVPPSIQDKIRQQVLYIAADKPTAALAWYDKIHDGIQSLAEFPNRCPLAPENTYLLFELRHLIVGNYRILFKVDSDTVVVLDFKESHQQK